MKLLYDYQSIENVLEILHKQTFLEITRLYSGLGFVRTRNCDFIKMLSTDERWPFRSLI